MTKPKTTVKPPKKGVPKITVNDRAVRNERIIALVADGGRVRDAMDKFTMSKSGIQRVLSKSEDPRLTGYFASTIADDYCDKRAERMDYELRQAKRYKALVVAEYKQHDVETIARRVGLSLRVVKAAIFLAIEAKQIEGPFADAA